MTVAIAREAAKLARPHHCPLCGTTTETNVIALPGIRIDVAARRTWIAGTEVVLSRKEFDIFEYFAHRPGTVVTKQTLYRDVWGHLGQSDTTRTIDAHLSRLRRKLESATGGVSMFDSVWGMGWRLRST